MIKNALKKFLEKHPEQANPAWGVAHTKWFEVHIPFLNIRFHMKTYMFPYIYLSIVLVIALKIM